LEVLFALLLFYHKRAVYAVWHDIRAVLMAALFEPFSLWLATWETPSLEGVPLVSLYKGRVVHASKTAKQLGITTGSSLAAALTKAPDLEAVEAASPYLAASWERLVEEVSGLSLVLESPMQGRLLMELEPSDAAQLAEIYKVRVGLAGSVEVALIAALISSPGRVRQVDAERQERLIDALPLYIFKGLGLSAGVQERLAWLGVEQVGQLRVWKKPQVLAYLGAEGKGLLPYLFGPFRTQLGRYTPAPRISVQLAFDEPLSEPHMLHPALGQLVEQLVALLDGKAASRLSATALSHGLELKATRLSKAPLQQAGKITRLALLTLEDTRAQPLGIDALTIELSGFTRPAKQGALWPQKERIEQAVTAVEARFPGAILKVSQDDPYSLASEHNVRFVARSTGEEVSREESSSAREHRDRSKRSSVEA
jgi:protein ImuB